MSEQQNRLRQATDEEYIAAFAHSAEFEQTERERFDDHVARVLGKQERHPEWNGVLAALELADCLLHGSLEKERWIAHVLDRFPDLTLDTWLDWSDRFPLGDDGWRRRQEFCKAHRGEGNPWRWAGITPESAIGIVTHRLRKLAGQGLVVRSAIQRYWRLTPEGEALAEESDIEFGLPLRTEPAPQAFIVGREGSRWALTMDDRCLAALRLLIDHPQSTALDDVDAYLALQKALTPEIEGEVLEETSTAIVPA